MDNAVRQVVRNVSSWLNHHHIALVFILSALHVGLSLMHAWDSGRADPAS